MMMTMFDPVSFIGRPQGAGLPSTRQNVNGEESFDRFLAKTDQKMKPRSNKMNPKRTEEARHNPSQGEQPDPTVLPQSQPQSQAAPTTQTGRVEKEGEDSPIANMPEMTMETDGDFLFMMTPRNLSKELVDFFPDLFKGIENASLLNPSVATSAPPEKIGMAQLISWKSPMLALEHQSLESHVIEQIIQKLSLQQLELHGKGGMTLTLEPKELGALKVEISVRKGAVSAEILTQNPAVREILEKNQTILLNALSHSGFNVEQFSVNVGDFQNRSDTGNEERFRFSEFGGSSSEASLLAGIGEALRGRIYPESAVSLYI